MSSVIYIGVNRIIFNKFCSIKVQNTCQSNPQSKLIGFFVISIRKPILQFETVAYKSTILIFHVKSMTLGKLEKICWTQNRYGKREPEMIRSKAGENIAPKNANAKVEDRSWAAYFNSNSGHGEF